MEKNEYEIVLENGDVLTVRRETGEGSQFPGVEIFVQLKEEKEFPTRQLTQAEWLKHREEINAAITAFYLD